MLTIVVIILVTVSVRGSSVGTETRYGPPGRDVSRPPPSSAEAKEGAELYLCFPFGFSLPVVG
jgi:hypothetical protein